MMRLAACLVTFAMGALGVAPPMPAEYSAVILMRMPYIPLKMPLRVLTSSTTQKIEYYKGLEVDTSSASGTYKFSFNNSKRVCQFSPPSAGPKEQHTATLFDDAWTPSTFLPDLSQYTEDGDEIVEGISCKKFSQNTHRGTTGTMDDHNTFYWDAVLDKPFRWHMHSRAAPFGSHTDEYILDYMSFQAGAPVASDLALPKLCSENPVTSDVAIRIGSFLKAASALQSTSKASAPLVFDAFLKQHGKAYAADEYVAREAVFAMNMALMDKLNVQHAGGATFKANQFMDMTRAEIMSIRGGNSKRSLRSQRRTVEQQRYVRIHETLGVADPPEDFDWRTTMPGAVGPVKDQAMCGSCWTYGVTEPIESAVAIQSKKNLVVLPEQFVLDCTWTNATGSSGGNLGCDGGDSDIGALEIVRKFGGILPTAASYGSYLSINGYCRDTRLMDTGAKITGWVDIKDRDEIGLMQALVAKGPMSVGIQVPDDMLYYDTGVLKVESCKYNVSQIDHAVVMVGYGTENGADYYLIRNSWSTYWGDLGYIKISRGDTDCCVSCQAGYPEVDVGDAVRGSVIV